MDAITSAPVDSLTLVEPPWYRRLGTDYLPYIFLAPAVITLLALTIYPFIYPVYISLFRFKGGNPFEFIGLNNYTDPLVASALWDSIQGVLQNMVSPLPLTLPPPPALSLLS